MCIMCLCMLACLYLSLLQCGVLFGIYLSDEKLSHTFRNVMLFTFPFNNHNGQLFISINVMIEWAKAERNLNSSSHVNVSVCVCVSLNAVKSQSLCVSVMECIPCYIYSRDLMN